MAAASQVSLPEATHGSAKALRSTLDLLVACCGFADTSEINRLLAVPIDFEHVTDSAEHHRLIPALCSAVATSNVQIPKIIRERGRRHAWRAMRFVTDLERIAKHFKGAEIAFLVQKGPALSQVLYGDLALRQFGDLDLLVRPRDVERARTALEELGYDTPLQLSCGQWNSYLRSGYECSFGSKSDPHMLELQWRIAPNFYSMNLDLELLFERSVEIQFNRLSVRTLGLEDSMLATCIHAAKHEWSQLGMLRDIAALSRFGLNWEWIVNTARQLGILTILQVSLLCGNRLFRLELPAVLATLPVTKTTSDVCARVIAGLQQNREPGINSFSYFLRQAALRERWLDRARFFWRLATTPSVSEWQTMQLPDRFGALYMSMRGGRLVKRATKSMMSSTLAHLRND